MKRKADSRCNGEDYDDDSFHVPASGLTVLVRASTECLTHLPSKVPCQFHSQLTSYDIIYITVNISAGMESEIIVKIATVTEVLIPRIHAEIGRSELNWQPQLGPKHCKRILWFCLYQ